MSYSEHKDLKISKTQLNNSVLEILWKQAFWNEQEKLFYCPQWNDEELQGRKYTMGFSGKLMR